MSRIQGNQNICHLSYLKTFKFKYVSLSIFYIVQILEIQFNWFFLQMNHIVVLYPMEPVLKIFELF
jgi:hypothetical protein